MDKQIADIANGLGWTVIDVPRVSSFGVPCVRDMYEDVGRRYSNCSFHAYSNGDILFNRGLAQTLYVVAKVIDSVSRESGQFWDVDSNSLLAMSTVSVTEYTNIVVIK